MDVLKACPDCGRVTLQAYRFCPWCGGAFALMELEGDDDVEVELGCGDECDDDIRDAAEADSGDLAAPAEGAGEMDGLLDPDGHADAEGEAEAVRRGIALTAPSMTGAEFVDDVVDRLQEVSRAGEGPRMMEMKKRLEALERDLDELIPDKRG